MHFDDFPYQKEIADSYIRSDDFRAYLRDYANHFGLNGLVKLNHLVIRVRPIEETKWEVSPIREALALVYSTAIQQVIAKDLREDKYATTIFDAIFICNGRNFHPNWPSPKFLGSNIFRGTQIHSHDFRKAEAYRSECRLIRSPPNH